MVPCEASPQASGQRCPLPGLVGRPVVARVEWELANDAVEPCIHPEKVRHVRPGTLDDLELIADVALVTKKLQADIVTTLGPEFEGTADNTVAAAATSSGELFDRTVSPRGLVFRIWA